MKIEHLNPISSGAKKQVPEGMQAWMKKHGKLDAFVLHRIDSSLCVTIANSSICRLTLTPPSAAIKYNPLTALNLSQGDCEYHFQ